MTFSLIKPLFEGPIDIIGDVHGELEALTALLFRLGYSEQGVHPSGRRLVFVGDLCDRGPDSPGVIRTVMNLVAAGRAQCVLGNHELNLLLGKRRQGNHWFEGLSEDPAHPQLGACVPLDPSKQTEVLDFISALPLGLEREDLRVVHAAWHEPSIEIARRIPDSVAEAYRRIEEAIEDSEEGRALHKAAARAQHKLSALITNPDTKWGPEHHNLIASMGAFGQLMQMANPIRVITSGLETLAETPFFSAGKWRFVTRVPWWRDYEGTTTVFGHYWRWYSDTGHQLYNQGIPALFSGEPPYMTEDHKAFCIDFSVGGRTKERSVKAQPPFHSRLAALRWPERVIVYDADAAGPVQREYCSEALSACPSGA